MTGKISPHVPKIPQPTTPKGKATVERILAAGHVLFGESGYVAMRMSDLAEKSDLSLGAIYRYFENKDDVFLAIINNVHEQLYAASRVNTDQKFSTHPHETIQQSNLGYFTHYLNHRHVMKAFMEATMVEKKYTDMWWYMREAHIQRVSHALKRDHNITELNGEPTRNTLEALASMTEQSAFVWYAVPSATEEVISPERAAKIVSEIWFRSLFHGT
ncbi:MAG: TetR/AcrR family transcriptional regulator [Alcaligenaceae bacterium]|jgi:AcrR family transcriptional regulator|nr:TetR/AcrR family transcriptional regulator [Alcaligenaceae bacterium]